MCNMEYAMRMGNVAALIFVFAVMVTARARAETKASAPSGGGLPALDVKVDLAGGAVLANGARIPISLDRSQLPAEGDVTVESVAIGQGRHVVHVRIPVKGDVVGIAWEAIILAGRAAPVFAGLTGLTSGDPGERGGKAVQIIPNGTASFVLVGDVREELHICGQTLTLLDPLALYPASLDLRPATVQRLSAEQQASAQRVIATDKGPALAAPLARLLMARGSSVPGSRGAELTDGDVRMVWTENRPGIGQGEFVVMAAPADVPISAMQVVVTKTGPRPTNGAAPSSFYIVTTTQAFQVTLPEDAWLKPGESYEIAFPQPIATSCVALVLDSAYTRGQTHPEVGVAELVAYSEFDSQGATLEDVARKLSGERGVAAAQVLERAGDEALAVVEKVFDTLDDRGRALAVDVAAAHARCEEAVPLLARGACNKGGQAARKAHQKLERCRSAALVLAKRLQEDPATRGCVAPTLAAIAPQEALDPIADAMAATPEGEGETRAALRGAFAQALTAAPSGKLAALLNDSHRNPAAKLEVMRAAEARVTEASAESEAAATELLRGSPPLRTRYLVLGPLEALARAGDQAAAARVAEAAVHDPDWPVRARAAEAAAGIAAAQAALLAASRDGEPRVREAALRSLSLSPSPAAVEVAKAVLTKEGWSFVKTQAIEILGKAPASDDVDAAVGGALHDRAVSVRGGAIVALARHRARSWHRAIRERLDDAEEDGEVRGAAARALGAVCDESSVSRLTELARKLGVPGTSEDEQQLALGALVGLAALKPRDLRERLAPLLAQDAPPHVRAAAGEALASRGACK
jgi:HEAT repeat protein